MPARGEGLEASGTPATGTTASLVLALGLVLGLAADRLLWEGPQGPGMTLWMALLGATAVLLARREGWAWTHDVAGWSTVAVASLAISMWRASPVLNLLLFLAAVVSASCAILAARGRRFGDATLADHVYGLLLTPWHALTGTLSLLVRAELPERWGGKRAAAIGRGVLLAVPPVLVFGALFASADPTFERAVGFLVPDLATLPLHLFLIGFFGWVSAGLLLGLFPGRTENPLAAVRPPRLGVEEIATVLGLVTALFAAFIVIQFSYLFGGTSALERISGLTVAEYARRGFFELLAVAGLVTVLLLLGDATAPAGSARRAFRVLAGTLIGLVMLVIGSAGLRLGLYIGSFGLTMARLFAAAAMAWIGLTLLVFAATTLRDRPRRFPAGALAAGLATLAVLTVMNPDALVARTNVARTDGGEQPVDAAYLTELSADAVPTLVAGLGALGPEARCELARTVLRRWGPDAERESGGWRTWNAGEARARAALTTHRTRIQALTGGC